MAGRCATCLVGADGAVRLTGFGPVVRARPLLRLAARDPAGVHLAPEVCCVHNNNDNDNDNDNDNNNNNDNDNNNNNNNNNK